MKKVRLTLLTMCAAALSAATFYGCYKGELYDINEPENLQSRIDEAARLKAERDKMNQDRESAEEPYQIGITGDFSNGWWTTFSKYYKLGKEDTVSFKFQNYSDCKANYHNWVAMVTNDVNIHDNDNGYKEYMGQRADRWDNVLGDNATFSGTMQSDLNNDDDWKAWLKTMKKADVELTIIRDRVGKVTIFSTTKTSDGKVWTCHQEKGVDTEGDFVRVFLVCEESYLQFYYCNKVGEEDPKSTIGEIDTGEDHFPVSISAANYPTAIEIGDEDYWKNGVATVVLDNGATITAEAADITFTVPDLTTVGKKTIILSYSKSKKGGYGQAVATSYQIDVTAPIQSIEIEAASNIFYYKPGATTPPAKGDIDVTKFIKKVLGKTGSADIEIATSDFTAEVTSVPATISDKIVITVTYKEFKADLEIQLQEESYTEISHSITGEIGSTTANYYSVSTDFVELGSGESVTFKFAQETSGGAQWNSWVAIVRDASDKDKVALRPDNWDNIAGLDAVGIVTTLTNKDGEIDDDWFKGGTGMAKIIQNANCEITFKFLEGVVSITTKTVANGTSIEGVSYDGYTYTTTYSPIIGTNKCKVGLTVDQAKLLFE